MTGGTTSSMGNSDKRRAPLCTALVGAVVVLILLSWPIRIGPGDHEARQICGTAWSMDVSRWHNIADGDYHDRAVRSCSEKRADRIVQAVAVGSIVVLLVAFVDTRSRRRAGRSRR